MNLKPASEGTPQTLEQAIINGLREVRELDQAPALIERHIKDYLAQRFSVAMFEHAECQAVLNLLFHRIVER